MSTQGLEHVASAELVDGAVIALRKLTLADVADVVRLYETLSDDECYYRFFTAHPAHLQTSALSLTEPSDSPIRPWRIRIRQAARRRQLLHRDRHTANVPRWRSSWLTASTCVESVRRCFVGSARSQRTMVCIISSPRCWLKTTPCIGS